LVVHNACPVGGIASTRGLQHSFDSHAAQWFAKHGGTLRIAKWQELIETATKLTKVVDRSIVLVQRFPKLWQMGLTGSTMKSRRSQRLIK
jgi:hypothetical protein